jgi:hypothetical protein
MQALESMDNPMPHGTKTISQMIHQMISQMLQQARIVARLPTNPHLLVCWIHVVACN